MCHLAVNLSHLQCPSASSLTKRIVKVATQLTFTCAKSTIETLEKAMKHVQS